MSHYIVDYPNFIFFITGIEDTNFFKYINKFFTVFYK